jgi:acetyl/propionyl-CoA carboxylase alpha subunit
VVREPGGPGVRVDSACEPGLEVTVHYDPLLAKLIVWGDSRAAAIARLRRAVDEYVLTGVRTTLPFHRWLVRDPAFLAGELSTAFIAQRWTPRTDGTAPAEDERLAQVAAITAAQVAGARRQAAGLQGAGAGASLPDSRWRTASRREALR